MGSDGASGNDETVLARRIMVDPKVSKGRFAPLIGIVFFVIVFALILLEGGFGGFVSIPQFSVFFVVLVLIIGLSFLSTFSIGKMQKTVKKAPIAARVSSDFTIDVYLDNGQRRSIYTNEITEVNVVGSKVTVSVSRGQSMQIPERLDIKLRSGETITLRYIEDAQGAKARIDAFRSSADVDEF